MYLKWPNLELSNKIIRVVEIRIVEHPTCFGWFSTSFIRPTNYLSRKTVCSFNFGHYRKFAFSQSRQIPKHIKNKHVGINSYSFAKVQIVKLDTWWPETPSNEICFCVIYNWHCVFGHNLKITVLSSTKLANQFNFWDIFCDDMKGQRLSKNYTFLLNIYTKIDDISQRTDTSS
jgi:hypothetical protein